MNPPYCYHCIFILCFLSSFAFGQGEPNPNGVIRCLTTEREAAYRVLYPEIESESEFESWMDGKVAERKRTLHSQRAVVTIPVIVHVIHNGENVGGGSNISMAQVHSQIDVLNEDFRKKSGTPGHNTHPDGADTEIEFCLAEVDPNGVTLAELGIHRVNRNTAGFTAPPFGENYIDNTLKPATSWDPTKYMNFWVCDIDNDILGFAKWPQSSGLSGINGPFPQPNIDGVVIRYKSFGNTGNVTAPYNEGRTATHEVGHFFGLRHIWGDGGCNADDYCADTPESDAGNFGCPFNHISCGNADMTENYMDYTDDVCMSIFTEDQKARMLIVLANSPRRMELVNSNVCAPQTSAPSAAFIADVRTGCPGLKVQFTDQSTNGATSWQWNFPGGSPSNSNQQNPPLITYSTSGTYAVSLIATNANGSNTESKSGYITIDASGLQVFYLEDFEGSSTDWGTINPDNETTWVLFSGIAGSRNGSTSAGIELYLYETIGERDGLVSPALDFSDKSNVKLEFDYAHRPYSANEADSLLIYISEDGGNTFPHLMFADAENGSGNFATNSNTNSNFSPTSDADWCYDGTFGASCFSVDLSAFDGKSNIAIMFETVNDYGNNIYVDNIKLLGSCGVVSVDPEKAGPTFLLYPNPNHGSFILEFEENLPGKEVSVFVFDMLGRQVFEKNIAHLAGRFKETISLNHAPAGTYMVTIEAGTNALYKKVVVR